VSRVGRLVLDTSTYSRFRAGDGEALDHIAQADVVLLPATVLGELYGGFATGRRERENFQTLSEFLSEPFVDVLPITREVAEQYGRVYAALRRQGRPVPVNDLWIAAATLDCGGHLVTFDSDFAAIPGLSATVLRS
jgi:predicted nucleic acid-binding protein